MSSNKLSNYSSPIFSSRSNSKVVVFLFASKIVNNSSIDLIGSTFFFLTGENSGGS